MATRSDPLPALVEAIAAALPARRPLPLHAPVLGAAEKARLAACIDSGYVSSIGPEVEAFEHALREFTGLPGVTATVNGSAALHLALRLAGVRPGDEVLMPALTFVGSANAVAACGARPRFVDVSAETLAVDPAALEAHLQATTRRAGDGLYDRRTGNRIAALMVVHCLGHLGAMEALAALARTWGLPLVEDAAEALGSRRPQGHAGAWGLASALSFNGNKIITTGGGGALLSPDPDLARRARHLATTAKQPHPWAFRHDAVAFNYRMPNLNAALGLAQMRRLPLHLEAKASLEAAYRLSLARVPGARLFAAPPGSRPNRWLQLLLLDDPDLRDPLLGALHARGLLARPLWEPLHRAPMYAHCTRAPLPVTVDLHARGICLPSGADLVEAA